MSYGTTNSADDRLRRLAAVTAHDASQPLGQFAWMGAGRLVSLTMPQPGIALSYKQAAGEPVGDSGDPYSGYDCPSLRSQPAKWLRMREAAIAAKQWFGRTVDMRWIKISDSASLSRIEYGFDQGKKMDDCGNCCDPGTIKPCPGWPRKNCCKCPEKDDDEKDKKKGFWSRLFKRCKLKVKTQETYKGSEIKVKPVFEFFKKGRVSAYIGPEFKAVGDRGNWPPQCVIGIEIKDKD